MEFETLTGLINNPAELITKLLANFKPLFELKAYKEYDVLFHKVNNKVLRKDKEIQRPTGETLADGKTVTERDIVPVNRISIPFQKLIVETTATFLTGGKIELDASTENDIEKAMMKAVNKLWKRNKLQFKTGQIAEYMMSQLECAELWFSDTSTDDQGKEVVTMKMNVLAPSLGYQLQPIYDGINNLIAFGVHYTQEKIQYYDLYTKDELRKHSNANGKGWQLISDDTGDTAGALIKLPYGKIPIIYYSQPRSEWYDVQSMIERLETMLSNHGDTNDYTGSPILFVKGILQGFADKGEPGKVLVGDKETDMEYISPVSAPESMKLEYENLKDLIHLMTATPDLSLAALKGLGQVPSGAAFERLLIATYMKAIRRQNGMFGECIQRRVNFLQAAAAVIDPSLKPAADMDIEVCYNLFKIDDLLDTITAWMAANGQKPLISHEESISKSGLSDDPEATFEKIKAEEAAIGNVLDPANPMA